MKWWSLNLAWLGIKKREDVFLETNGEIMTLKEFQDLIKPGDVIYIFHGSSCSPAQHTFVRSDPDCPFLNSDYR